MAAQDFELFPNPTRDFLTVRMEQPLSEPGSVIVWDLTGRAVMEVEFERIDASLRLDLRQVTNGTYMVEIRTESFNGRRKIVRMQ